LFELETDDITAVISEVNNRIGTAAMPISDAFDLTTIHVTIVEDI